MSNAEELGPAVPKQKCASESLRTLYKIQMVPFSAYRNQHL